MIIDCIADLHGHYPRLKGGDLLLMCGDYTAGDNIQQWGEFFHWLKQQQYRKKILIAGNHDNFMYTSMPRTEQEAKTCQDIREALDVEEEDFEYLCDSGTEFEGLKIWGSPWTLWFDGVNPKCKAFMSRESKITRKFNKIPKDTDILMTHSPPFGMLDKTIDDIRAGSVGLSNIISELKLKYHLFGHIHEAYGQCHQGYKQIKPILRCTEVIDDSFYEPYGHLSVNCSHVNEHYQPVNKPVRIEL